MIKGIVYLAGPCSGIPEYNRPAFDAATTLLRTLGYQVINPHEVCAHINKQFPADQVWLACMAACLPMVVRCDTMVMLPGFQHSKGAMIEMLVANSLGKSIMIYREMEEVLAHKMQNHSHLLPHMLS